MNADEVVDCLAAEPMFLSVPRAELDWIAARGDIRAFDAGATIIEPGATVDEMFILLTGRAAVYAVTPGGGRRILDMTTGNVLGAIPYSRASIAPAAVVAEEDARALVLGVARFPDMMRDCPAVIEALVHNLLDRARDFRTAQLHSDRMKSLGRLASPASRTS